MVEKACGYGGAKMPLLNNKDERIVGTSNLNFRNFKLEWENLVIVG